jgi:hypothetical protein
VFAPIFVCIQVRAQYDNGSLMGTIRDASGAPIANAAVKILNSDTGIVSETKTNAAGDYEAPTLRVGVYNSHRQRCWILRCHRSEDHRLGRQSTTHRRHPEGGVGSHFSAPYAPFPESESTQHESDEERTPQPGFE